MSQIFTIENDKVVITKLSVDRIDGPVLHTGELEVVENVTLGSDLTVAGTVTADTLVVKNLITEHGSPNELGNWTTNTEEELIGKGLNWTWGNGIVQLMYRDNNRLWSNANIDLESSRSYKIDGTPVLSLNELGSQVVKSNLREVGTLRSLNVTGTAILSEFAYFDSGFGRLGLNTDEPHASLSILDNDVEIVLGAPNFGIANIGTYTNHDLSIVTDNIPRLTIKNTGTIVIGNEATKTADVIIHGTLKVDTIISDTRIDRYSPLEFLSTRDSAIYGKGLIWSGTGAARHLIMLAEPDRLWSSESLDLSEDKSYHINGVPVLTGESLGNGIVKSKLTSVGVLESLTVEGTTRLSNNVEISGNIAAKTADFTLNGKALTISGNTLNGNDSISIKTLEDEAFYADSNEINIGNKMNVRKPVKVYGPMSVGVNTPDPTVDLTVKGDVSFANKKFTTGVAAPTIGSHNKGDICWNTEPQPDSFIGWVCISSGAPGTWAPFGAISR